MNTSIHSALDFEKSPSLFGSEVFLQSSNGHSGVLSIESDDTGEILGNNMYLIDCGHSLIQELLKRPLTEKSEILKRQHILRQMSEIERNIFEKLNHDSQVIGYLFSAFFSDNLTYEDFVRFSSKLTNFISKTSSDPQGAWSFGLDFDTVHHAGKLIPNHIKTLRGIGGEFYLAISDELETASKHLSHFPVREVFSLMQKLTRVSNMIENITYGKHYHARKAKLKKISQHYCSELEKIYTTYQSDIVNFTHIYAVVDAIIILASHIRANHLTASKISEDDEEKGYNIRDARIILGTRMTGIKDDSDEDTIETHRKPKNHFLEYIPNNLPKDTYPLEFYSGGNGSGKSAWLKTRLSLQLFHQAFGYGAGENISLPVRKQIVFMNRGGSGYAENLSAFGSDVEKLKDSLGNIQNNSVFIFDEFGSTIPENEGYALSRGLIEFLRENGAKIIFSTHNERLIQAVESKNILGSFMGHFPTEFSKTGVHYSRKLTSGADVAHTLSVFQHIGFDPSILAQARIMMSPDLKLRSRQAQQLTPREIQHYTPEERESLKNMTGIGFAGLTRAIDMLPSPYPEDHTQWYLKFPIPKKESQNFSPNYSISRYANTDQHALNKDGYIPPSFELQGSLDSRSVDFPHELYPCSQRNIPTKFSYCSNALKGVLSFGMTSDPRELIERQQFFSELSQLNADSIEDLSNEIYTFGRLINAFHEPKRKDSYGYNSRGLWCDFNELTAFNQSLWNAAFSCTEFGGGQDRTLVDTIIKLFEIEKILGNIDCTGHTDFIGKLKRYRSLSERLDRAKNREWKERYKEYESSAKVAHDISTRIQTLFQEEFGGHEVGIIKLIEELKGIVSTFTPYDILKISKKKQREIWKITKDNQFFRLPKQYNHDLYGRSILDEGHSINDLLRIINALEGTGTLIDPLLAKLRSLDSVHAHQLASYLESMIKLPTIEEFTDRVKRRVRDPLFLTTLSNWNNPWNNPRYKKEQKYILPRMQEENHFHPTQLLAELCGLVHTANRIQELGWKPVTWNTSGDIHITGLSHPGKKELPREQQIHSDFALKSTEHFDILEGATMGGKTMHLQSVMWAIRLAHSVGYVPAESAEMPIFDGIVYLDRILEDESANMSAGQKDAQYWKELIDKVIVKVGIIGVGGNYWWAIDEMISSVPSRYQKGLVIAILEKLKSLGQRGQISIHNPDFVSKILSIDPEGYTIHHPEILTHNDGKVESTHRIIPGRSYDIHGNFSAFSLETAEMMGLNSDIISRAKKYRSK